MDLELLRNLTLTQIYTDSYLYSHLHQGLTQMWSLAVEVAFYLVLPGLAYLLFNAGMKRLSATAAVVTGTLEAVLNPVWVFLGVGERPSPYALAGGVLILATIAWYTLRPSPRRPAAP